MATEGVIIKLPKDPNIVLALGKKKEEYGKRFEGINNPACYGGREWGALFKFELVRELIENGEVNTWQFNLELARKYPGLFDIKVLNCFTNACAVVEHYCKNGVREAA